MAHEIQPIFFGLLKPKNNIQKIWMVFALLSVVTTIEVFFGIVRPSVMVETKLIGLHLLNWFFIILTIYKAYYIAWAFMHLDGEHKWMRRSVVWTGVFFIAYIAFIFLIEGNYIFEIMKNGFITRNF